MAAVETVRDGLKDAEELSFGEWLQRRRLSLGLTQHALGDRVGYTASMVREIEAGRRRPAHDQAERLGEVLRIPAELRSDLARWARGAGAPPRALLLDSATGVLPDSHEQQHFGGERNSASDVSGFKLQGVVRRLSAGGPVRIGVLVLLVTTILSAPAISNRFTDSSLRPQSSSDLHDQAVIVEPSDGQHLTGEWIPVRVAARELGPASHLWIVESRGGFYWPQREAIRLDESTWEAWARAGSGAETHDVDIQVLAV